MKLYELIRHKFSGKHILSLLFFLLFAFTSNAQSGNQTAQLLTAAETAYSSGDYGSALYFYQKVLRLKGTDATVQQKIESITKMLEEKPDVLAQQIENAIINGEDLLKKNDYPAAKKEFEKALSLDPSSQYPLDKLSQIRQKYTDPDDAGNYEAAIQKAAGLMKQFKYVEAIQWYNIARSANPDAKLPIEKIAEARRLKVDYESKRTKYDALVKQADKQLADLKRDEALKTYKEAGLLFPDENYPKEKIAEIDNFFASKKATQDSYDAAVNAGDAFYINRDFANARIKYQEALKVKPDARYPKDMLEKTKSGESQLATVRDQFDNLITSADKFYAASDWNAALQGYTSASELFPGEEYPKTQISKIQKTQADLLSKKQQYDNLIAEADAFFIKTDYTNALNKYKDAQPLQPQETYPATKIAEINKLVADKQALESSYANAIKLADAAFAKKDYPTASKSYADALGYKPEENYPKDKIAEIEKIEASNRSLVENYSAAIEKADQFFTSENWQEALNSYKEASNLKPEEKYPKTRIAEVTAKIDALDKQNKSYGDLIAAADAAFGNSEFAVAKTKYTGALAIKPNESYPKEKLAEIDIKLADAAKLEADFKTAMDSGAELFSKNELQGALSAYKSAALIKPAEKLPAQKIDEINKLLAANQAKDENYSSLIQEADKAFNENDLSSALAKFTSASALKPSENYPKQKIDAINKMLAEQKAIDDQYLTLIATADKLYESAEYDAAIAVYNNALKLKPAEKYPSEQIAAIKDIIAKNKSIDEQYLQAVADGDKLLLAKNYDEARKKFENALGLKNKEKYPQQKITEIDLLLNEIKTRNNNYDQAVKSGDDFFNQTKYREALEPYQRANTVKPEEKYPLDQIARINDTLNLQAKRDEDFKAILAQADKNFTDKKYEEAKNLYTRSLTLKPSEKYPSEKINEINDILGKQKETLANYNKLIAEGDISFAVKEFEKALNSYNDALKVLPADKLAQEKMTLTQTEIKKRDENFNAEIALADKSFSEKQFTQATDLYNKALMIKPNEKYPSEKIAEISSIMQKQKDTRNAYDKLIAEGDVAVTASDFEKALISYNDALKLIPAEKTAQEKITSTQAEIKKRDENYNSLIVSADKSFTDKAYSQAIDLYNKALQVKPNEQYPGNQINKITDLLAQQKEEQEKLYSAAILNADALLASQDLINARTEYNKALSIKPNEKYPTDKVIEINTILTERSRAAKAEYDKIIVEADKYYQAKVLDQALETYSKAAEVKPDESYPIQMVSKIRQYIADHAFVNLNKQSLSLGSGEEKKFTFTAIEPRLKKNNYILIHGKASSTENVKVYLNYGKDNQKNGGVVLRNLSANENDILVRISVQDKWYREDNNWISLNIEGGNFEVSRMDVIQGDE